VTDYTGSEGQFESAAQREHADTFGMWIFLVTEVLFFGGLFLAYAIGLLNHGDGFRLARQETNLPIGAANTALLLVSSFVMTCALRAAQVGRPRALRLLLALCVVLGATFLALKTYEYVDDYRKHLVPTLDFAWSKPHPDAARHFFFLYFMMTGLHFVHLTIAVGLTGYLAAIVRPQAPLAGWQARVEVTSLYWHFVDIIWVLFFALLYLGDRT
jgi:cytochrome c oxidase subunit 3